MSTTTLSGAGTLIGSGEQIFTGVACREAMKAPDAPELRQKIIDDYIGFDTLDLDYEPLVVGDAAAMTHDEWMEERKNGIGASEICTLFDLNPFHNKYKLYHSKIGTKGRYEEDVNEYTLAFGHALEPVVRQEVARRLRAQSFVDTRIFRHPLYPWLKLNLDGLMLLPDGTLWLYEGKTTGFFNTEGWANDNIPEKYKLQGASAMSILNVDRIIYGYGTDNSPGNVEWRKMTRDLNLEEDIIAESRRFWHDNILARIEPPATGPMAVKYKMMYGNGPIKPGIRKDGDVTPSPEVDACIRELLEATQAKNTLKDQMDTVEVRAKEAQARLEDLMGDITHTQYEFYDGSMKVRISDGVQVRQTVDWKAIQERDQALATKIQDDGFLKEGEPFRIPRMTIMKN